MRFIFCVCIATVSLATFSSCQNNEQATATIDSNPVTNVPKVQKDQGSNDKPFNPQEAAEKESEGLLDVASELLKQATDSRSEGADITKKWLADKLDQATDSGADATEWATDMYKFMKDQGMTSADNARDWLTEDIRNMNAFKYKIAKLSLDDLEAVEDQLNELGKLRWECFHAVEKDGETILFFKKGRRSFLKNIPVKDMMKLLPLMGGGGEE